MFREEALRALGLTGEETPDEIKRAYLRQIRLHGPDKDPERFRQIREAFEALQRNAFDVIPLREEPAHSAPDARPELLDLLHLPREQLVPLAHESTDLARRFDAITALVELSDYVEAERALIPLFSGEDERHAPAFALACRTVLGMHALGVHTPALALTRRIIKWAGNPPRAVFVSTEDAALVWTYARECLELDKAARVLCRFAVSRFLRFRTHESAAALNASRNHVQAYTMAVDEVRVRAPGLYAILEPALQLPRADGLTTFGKAFLALLVGGVLFYLYTRFAT